MKEVYSETNNVFADPYSGNPYNLYERKALLSTPTNILTKLYNHNYTIHLSIQ